MNYLERNVCESVRRLFGEFFLGVICHGGMYVGMSGELSRVGVLIPIQDYKSLRL